MTDQASNQPRVSVIIPVYNTGECLGECLDSVLAQHFSDIEVLCVDDGSTDQSPEVLADYAARDGRVRVLRNDVPSRGPGAARNMALNAATGQFVAFIDSDDLIRPEMIDTLYAAAVQDDADIAMCCFEKFNHEDGVHPASCTYDRTIPEHLDTVPFTWVDLGGRLFELRFASCNKLYRRGFLRDRGLTYEEDAFYEDLPFTFRALLEADRLRFVRQALYLNRKQREGATTFDQGDRVFDALAAMQHLEAFLATRDEFRCLDEAFAAFRFRNLRSYLHKNDLEHIQPFYAALQQYANDPALDENPFLAAEEQRQREQIRQSNLFEFLVRDYWNVNTDLGRVRRRMKIERRGRKRAKAKAKRLRAENERLMAEVEQLGRELDAARDQLAVARPGPGRMRAAAKTMLGPRGVRITRSVVRRGRTPGASP